MKNFGLGKKSLELRIAEEAEMLNKAFEEEKGNEMGFLRKLEAPQLVWI